ncbi:MAG TPA: CopG family transcriptional regulator [Nodosilinea sp.]|nr:CopG family transcriptional regulator [Nodosilinea sp.]
MQTTLDLEDDILSAVEELAQQQGISPGKVLSDLARQALAQRQKPTVRNGLPLFPVQPGVRAANLDVVNRLRDEVP